MGLHAVGAWLSSRSAQRVTKVNMCPSHISSFLQLPGALKAVSRAARGGGTGAAATAGSSTATEAGSAAAASGGDGEGDASDEEEEEEEGGLDGGEGEGLTGEGSRSKASVKSQGQGASGSAAAAAGGAGGSAAFTQLRPLLAPPSQQPSQGSVAAVGAGGAESAAAWWPVVLGPEAGARLDALAAGKSESLSFEPRCVSDSLRCCWPRPCRGCVQRVTMISCLPASAVRMGRLAEWDALGPLWSWPCTGSVQRAGANPAFARFAPGGRRQGAPSPPGPGGGCLLT